jgi:hypothetical protein
MRFGDWMGDIALWAITRWILSVVGRPTRLEQMLIEPEYGPAVHRFTGRELREKQ